MSIFNFGKNKSTIKEMCDEGNIEELTLAVQRMYTSASYENQKAVAKILYSLAKEKKWVYIPIHSDNNGIHFEIYEHNRRYYAAMLSDNTQFKKNVKFDISITDINKLIKLVFTNDGLAGIVINPYTKPIYLHKGFLLKCLLHEKYPEFQIKSPPPKDWGKGIPAYNKSDLMSQEEINSFAWNTFINHEVFVKNGDHAIATCDYPGAIPNLIMQLNGNIAFILVKGFLGENEPTITSEELTNLLSLGEEFNAECYFATVGFLSVDPERGERNLALKGDAFRHKIPRFDRLK